MPFTLLTLAYIGPGAGLGLIMALIGLATAIGAALLSVVLWPIRNMLKRRGQENSATSD